MKKYELQEIISDNATSQLAMKIFIKKLPNDHINETTIRNIHSVAQQAIQAAQIFMAELENAAQAEALERQKEAEGLTPGFSFANTGSTE